MITVEERDRIRALSENPEIRQVLKLVISGIPFDVAMSLSNEERAAWVIAIGEIESAARFDWDNWRWMERD